MEGKRMKFFIDTANMDEIREAYALGLLAEVTTNPSLVAKEGNVSFHDRLKEITDLVPGSVSAEVIALDAEGMIKEGKELAAIAPNITVKVPMTPDGLKAVKEFTSLGIKTNVTLIFSANQALMAARAGATYVSPFIGRLDDIGHDGLTVISDIVQIFSNYDITTQVLVASIRHPIHVIESAKLGADVVTLPPEILQKMIHHPLTDKGLDIFLADWEKLKKGYSNSQF